jgi:hypothetical protein
LICSNLIEVDGQVISYFHLPFGVPPLPGITAAPWNATY